MPNLEIFDPAEYFSTNPKSSLSIHLFPDRADQEIQEIKVLLKINNRTPGFYKTRLHIIKDQNSKKADQLVRCFTAEQEELPCPLCDQKMEVTQFGLLYGSFRNGELCVFLTTGLVTNSIETMLFAHYKKYNNWQINTDPNGYLQLESVGGSSLLNIESKVCVTQQFIPTTTLEQYKTLGPVIEHFLKPNDPKVSEIITSFKKL